MIDIQIPTQTEESFELVDRKLKAISQKLFELLPDLALSPLERLERLARVAPETTMVSAYHRTARSKLNELRLRLAEIVPSNALNEIEKIEFLESLVHARIPSSDIKFFKKLEALGDTRPSDNGR